MSVILTGNAGDGKTHLIRHLKGRLGNARIVEDASTQDPSITISEWQRAINDGVPFCMAANEWPLFQMISTYGKELSPLQEVRNQIRSSLAYDANEDVAAQQDLMVINLGLRNPLASDFLSKSMRTLLAGQNLADCQNCAGPGLCDATRNRDLIMDHPRVKNALIELLGRLAIYGEHVTVRQLFAFFSYAIFGGRDQASLSHEHDKNKGFYSEQIFSKDARGNMFDLLRNHLDPAKISHPKWDARLLYSGTDDNDWELKHVPLAGAGVENTFQFMKRRFYFEHAHGLDILNMLTKDEVEFARLLDPQNNDLDAARDELVTAINAFFCPYFAVSAHNSTKALYVWSSHSYDERVPRAFTSWYTIDRRHIKLKRPRLATRLADAFGYRPDHLRIDITTHKQSRVSLVIDYDLYHTLMEVQRGLPPVLVDEGKSVRLFRFMSQLEAGRDESDTPLIFSYLAQSNEILRVEPDTIRRRLTLLS